MLKLENPPLAALELPGAPWPPPCCAPPECCRWSEKRFLASAAAVPPPAGHALLSKSGTPHVSSEHSSDESVESALARSERLEAQLEAAQAQAQAERERRLKQQQKQQGQGEREQHGGAAAATAALLESPPSTPQQQQQQQQRVVEGQQEAHLEVALNGKANGAVESSAAAARTALPWQQ